MITAAITFGWRITLLIWDEPRGILHIKKYYVEGKYLEKLKFFVFLFQRVFSFQSVFIKTPILAFKIKAPHDFGKPQTKHL